MNKKEETKNILETCPVCGGTIIPIWYLEEEYTKNMIPTGRKRKAVDYLECTGCGKRKCVDSEYLAGPWQ